MNPNFLFHIALPLCAFIAGITAGIVIYRGRLRDALSQLTLTNAYLEAEKELKDEAVKAAETEESLRMDEIAEKQRVFECLVHAVSKMPVPFNMRERDQFGRFRKVDPITIARALVKEKNPLAGDHGEIQRLCNEIRDNAVNDLGEIEASDGVNTESALNMGRTMNIANEHKSHTLRHGMTVKDPTPEQAKEIFEEARRLGIADHSDGDAVSSEYPWIWYYTYSFESIGVRDGVACGREIFITPSQFLSHMRGEA